MQESLNAAAPRRQASGRNVVVVGTQWGDEGKGKVVDWLTDHAQAVVRFQGGHNAGHTLVIGDNVYKLSLLPSGIVRGKLSVIGNGVVLDPRAFVAEVKKLADQGVTVEPRTLRIAENTPLILSLHQELDRLRESATDGTRIGTTYAETFPGNVRALVLDGALDPDQDSVDELVAGALILYPRYLDPRTRLPCGPELVIDRLSSAELWRPGMLIALRRLQGAAARRWRGALTGASVTGGR